MGDGPLLQDDLVAPSDPTVNEVEPSPTRLPPVRSRLSRLGRTQERLLGSPKSRRRVGLLVVYLVSTAFLGWTAATAGTRSQYVGYPDYFAELTEGFLHGELSIPTLPPKGLLDLPNPYDPLENKPYRTPFGDLALYKGHLYVDWGPAPVVTLYLPWHLIFSSAPSGTFADWLYCVVGLGFCLAAFDVLLERFLPAARARWVALIGMVLAIEGALPFIVREPDNYEVAVACSYCFAMVGLYLLASSGLPERLRSWHLAGASLAFGLSAASRQDLTLLGALLLPVLYVIWHRYRSDGVRRLAVRMLPVVAPFACIIVLLALYNYARFGSPTEIGSSYQLAGFNPRITPYYQLSYVIPSLYFYLVSPLHWIVNFPFFEIPPPIPPLSTPISYQPQIIAGIVSEAPILLVLLVAPMVLWHRLDRVLRTALITMVAVGFATIVLIALSIPGGSERYVVDFSTLFLLPAGICWLAWSPRRHLGRLAVRGVGTVLIAYGAIGSIAVSITGYYDQITETSPGFYSTMSRATSWVAPMIASIVGRPIIIAGNAQAGLITDAHWNQWGIGNIVYMNISGQPTQFSTVTAHSGTWSFAGSFGPGPQFGAAGTDTVEVVITDATGTHQYFYDPGEDYFPVRLTPQKEDFFVSVEVLGKKLPVTDSILSASGVNFGGPPEAPPPAPPAP